MLLTTRVKLFTDGNRGKPLPGVKVSLYDRDNSDDDDLLATATTDEVGEIFFSYDSDLYTDTEDQPSWYIDSLPDLFVIVYDAKDQVVISTRAKTRQDKLVRVIEVPISQELVAKHGLISDS